MRDYVVCFGHETVLRGTKIGDLTKKAKEYLLNLQEGNLATTAGGYCLTIWEDNASVLIGVMSDDANGINLHKLHDWERLT